MSRLSRRAFMSSSASAAAVAFGAAGKASANDRVRHAVIGVGSQGRRHAQTFSAFADCDVVALCDLDPRRRAQAARELTGSADIVQTDDFRRILDDASVDSVSVATPDHWHTPVALAALQAGKHVYVEKPCSHTLEEGTVLEVAARKSGKCVQHGTQSRSSQGILEAVQFLREGNLGKVRLAKAINHQLRDVIGRAPETDPPEGVNYDRWLGPAPVHRFTTNRWHYNWHWFWDYGSGDIGNDGIHQLDVARWGLGVGFPNAVSASGGQLLYDDDHETPDTQVVTYEYDDCYLVYEMRLWTDYKMEGHDNGTIFYGDKGTLEVGREGCEVTLIGEPKRLMGSGSDFDGNLRNFLDCVKADDPSKLNAPIIEGMYSAALCHLGNTATRAGRRLHFDAEVKRCMNDEEANRLLSKEYRQGYELPGI